MLKDLSLFKTSSALAEHAATRQSVIARNIAHADTPHYRAMDIAPFSEIYRNRGSVDGLRVSRPGHMAPPDIAPERRPHIREVPGDSSPNGNTVSLETEMINSTQVRHKHELALSVYRSGLDLLRTSLGRR